MTTEPFKRLKNSNRNEPNGPESHPGSRGHEPMLQFYREMDERLSKTMLILGSDNYKYFECLNLSKDKKKYFVKGRNDLHKFKGKEDKIIVDLTKRSTCGGGSIFDSILALAYMGFKEIYLCGAGYTYEPVYVLHFYDNFAFPKSMGREKAEIAAKKAIDNRNMKILSNYEYHGIFEKNDLYMALYSKKMGFDSNMDKHRILNDYARSQRVKIYNIVPDGFESPIYEKRTWGEVVNNVLPNQPNQLNQLKHV